MSEAHKIEPTLLPIAASKGGNNAYYHWCDAMEQKRNYGSCLMLVDAYEAGRLEPEGTVHDSCAMAMSRGRCNAISMRDEEREKGHALYFKERIIREAVSRPVSVNDPGYKVGWNKVPGNPKRDLPVEQPKPRAVAPKPAQQPQGDTGYAAVVNDMMREHAEKEDKQAILDKVRRLKELRALKAQKENKA